MENRKGILLTTDFDVKVKPKRLTNGLIISGFVIGSTIDQDIAVVLKLNAGDLKENPLVGPGLTKFIRGKSNQSQIDAKIRQHLSMIGVDWSDYKARIKTRIKTTES